MQYGGESLIIDSIKEIRDLEEKLEKDVQKAEIDANNLIKKTREEGEAEAKEIVEKAKAEAEKLVETKQAEAQKLSDDLLKKGEAEFEQMKNLKDEDLKGAVDFVLERIVI